MKRSSCLRHTVGCSDGMHAKGVLNAGIYSFSTTLEAASITMETKSLANFAALQPLLAE